MGTESIERYKWVLLLLIWLTAVSLRVVGNDWDLYHHYHPDERYIAWVASSIEFNSDTAGWQSLLTPHESNFNPFYWPETAQSVGVVVPLDEPRKFAYGHVPLYLGVLATRLLENLSTVLLPRLPADSFVAADLLNGRGAHEFEHITVVARFVIGLVDSLTVLLIFALGRRLYSTAVGLLAALFLALNVMHVQIAHFFTSDPILAFFVVLALYAMIAAVQETDQASRAGWRCVWLLLAAAALGLAIGSKFSAILLGLAMALATFWAGESGRLAVLRRWIGYAATLFVVFAVTNPFALLDNTCTADTQPAYGLSISSCYLQNVGEQNTMVNGGIAFPFIRQYENTTAYLYSIEMQLRWGMGWPLGLLAFGGMFYWSWTVGRAVWRKRRDLTAQQKAELLVFVWVWPFFLSTGSFFVKFMRYLLPLAPFLMLFAAWFVMQLPRKWRLGVGGITVVATAVYALAFAQIYTQSHPWVRASEWIYAEIPAGNRIVSELWDESFPTSLGVIDGEELTRRRYDLAEVNWLSRSYERDTAEKVLANLEVMAEGDVYMVASQRGYAVTTRLPEAYPQSQYFYPALFAEALGYELAYVADRPMRMAGWEITPDLFAWVGLEVPETVQAYYDHSSRWRGGRIDESFVVYDQPTVMVFVNTGRLTAAEMEANLQTYAQAR